MKKKPLSAVVSARVDRRFLAGLDQALDQAEATPPKPVRDWMRSDEVQAFVAGLPPSTPEPVPAALESRRPDSATAVMALAFLAVFLIGIVVGKSF